MYPRPSHFDNLYNKLNLERGIETFTPPHIPRSSVHILLSYSMVYSIHSKRTLFYTTREPIITLFNIFVIPLVQPHQYTMQSVHHNHGPTMPVPYALCSSYPWSHNTSILCNLFIIPVVQQRQYPGGSTTSVLQFENANDDNSATWRKSIYVL